MDREAVLAILVLCSCGSMLLAGGFWARSATDMTAEHRCWRRLWLPLLPSLAVLSLLIGWALQEPDACDERLRFGLFAVALPFALIWARAVGRALWALRPRRAAVPVATVGLWRPHIRIEPPFVASVDAHALAAARAHEVAHSRHRDPLRIWLAQWATDLQWPGPAAARRWRDWRWALELARDDEARASGVDGADLAAAIVAAARLCTPSEAEAANLIGDGAGLAARVDRLLRPVPAGVSSRTRRWPGLALLVAVALTGCTLGAMYGERLVLAIPGVLR